MYIVSATLTIHPILWSSPPVCTNLFSISASLVCLCSHQSEWPSSKRSTNNKCWRGCGEKATFLPWECKLIEPLRRTVWRSLKKLKHRTVIWPSIPTTEHIQWENHNSKRYRYPSVHWSSIHNSQDMKATWMSTWKQPRFLLLSEWINKMWYIYIQWNTTWPLKRNEIESFVLMWMNLEPVIQNAVSKQEKNKYHILMHVYGI